LVYQRSKPQTSNNFYSIIDTNQNAIKATDVHDKYVRNAQETKHITLGRKVKTEWVNVPIRTKHLFNTKVKDLIQTKTKKEKQSKTIILQHHRQRPAQQSPFHNYYQPLLQESYIDISTMPLKQATTAHLDRQKYLEARSGTKRLLQRTLPFAPTGHGSICSDGMGGRQKPIPQTTVDHAKCTDNNHENKQN
jgi:hypothetical protein